MRDARLAALQLVCNSNYKACSKKHGVYKQFLKKKSNQPKTIKIILIKKQNALFYTEKSCQNNAAVNQEVTEQ